MSARELAGEYEGIVCDLDGVVFAGPRAIAHAVEALNALTQPVVFATNNASRSPSDVGGHLRDLGVEVDDASVLTSSLAGARLLARELPTGSPVLAVGGSGVSEALRAVGLQVFAPGEAGDPVAVMQGFGPQVTASDLGEAAHAIRAGATWVATNDDLTLPTERGPAPGNGSLLAAVRRAVDVDPRVIGKPRPPMYELAADVLGVDVARVLAIGDRLETDIQGAVSTGMSGVLVLTGVHGVADAAEAPPERRPTYVVEDLRGLHEDYPRAERDGHWSVRGSARAKVGTELVVEGAGIDADRAMLDAVWDAIDTGRLSPHDAGRLAASR